ncbi:MAG: sigma-70 family RNA polymerase sigma factor [Phycisphaerales bacterium]|nr:sigma-70 family RNA polymerase sigma factor [Phycisphaerales bacterium]
MPNDPRTDQELLDAVRAGDPTAFEALYLRHRDWAFRVARRFTSEDARAMDAAQESFLFLLKRAPTLRLTARLTTFLYPTVKHHALAQRRSVDQADADRPAEVRAPPIHTDERLALLESALARLPDPQREALLMQAVDGMTHGEIALALSIPLGTVKSRIHAAVNTLRSDGPLRGYFED